MALRLSFCNEVKIPHYICELKQLVYLPVLTIFLMTWCWNLQLGCWVVFPLLVSFNLILSWFPPYIELHQLRGSIKHSPPVHITCQLSPYFIVQA